jgi:predicted dehydrogenase
MAPIRIGIVGLSKTPGTWGMLAHLPRLESSPNFKIVALCNSSVDAAKAAIEQYKLPESTKAYSKYEDLANDPDVDLYVVSTRADTHYEVALPALKAGKNVYVEWPLAATTAQAKEMVSLAREKKLKTIIGLQGRASPSIKKVKEMVEQGRLGEIHSVNFQGAINIWQNNAVGNKYHYFMDRKIGGNLLTIYGGHILDSLLYAVGELKPGNYVPMLGNLRRKMHRTEEDGSLSKELYEKDTPDQILIQGRLDREPQAVLSFHLRAGDRFIGSPGSIWRIYGTKGELAVEFASAGPQIGAATSFRFSNSDTGKVEEIEVDEGGDEWTKLPTQGQNIGRLYEEYANGDDYGDWELALKRHELLDEFWATWTGN